MLESLLKQSRDFIKTNNICEVNFQCYRPNVFQWFSEWFSE